MERSSLFLLAGLPDIGVKATRVRIGSADVPGEPVAERAGGAQRGDGASAARSKNIYLSAKYKRIATRRGPMRAIVAVEHAMIIAATKARAANHPQALGFRVTLEPLADSAQLAELTGHGWLSPNFRVNRAANRSAGRPLAASWRFGRRQ